MENNIDIDKIELKPEERQRCEIWTRVMGYYRPTDSFNIGKKQEADERVCFSQSKFDSFVKEKEGKNGTGK